VRFAVADVQTQLLLVIPPLRLEETIGGQGAILLLAILVIDAVLHHIDKPPQKHRVEANAVGHEFVEVANIEVRTGVRIRSDVVVVVLVEGEFHEQIPRPMFDRGGKRVGVTGGHVVFRVEVKMLVDAGQCRGSRLG
jgi:hypothetical protein